VGAPLRLRRRKGALRSIESQPERYRQASELEACAIFQRMRRPRLDPHAIDPRIVRAAEINNGPLFAASDQPRVLTAYAAALAAKRSQVDLRVDAADRVFPPDGDLRSVHGNRNFAYPVIENEAWSGWRDMHCRAW